MTRPLIALALCLFAVAPVALAAPTGEVTCAVTENGQSALGTVHVEKDGTEVASASCAGQGLAVPPGSYVVRLQLDGALDGPEQRKNVTVTAGQKTAVSADFATGTLEVRIQRKGRRAAGMAMIRRGGKQVGTLGGGVVAHLSAGQYEVVVRYRDEEQRFASITIDPSKPAVVEATFE